MKNYYEILEVNPKASKEIIEKAYRTLVKRYHPDLYSSVQKREAEAKLKEINEAYNILSDDFLRGQYDLELKKEEMRYEELKNRQVNNESYNINNSTTINNRRSRKNEKSEPINKKIENKKKNNVGTVFGIVELVKELWSNIPKGGERRKFNKTDFLAIGLTIVVILILGVILWFIPFTNGWMRQLLFENPIFNFIGGLFS